ncbi:AAA family ATPase [Polaromonas sp.]|uniref:AAA family ATPase n=1 Tax=Polaromonas sp. TaxID=1869339 RepID=UPI003C881797
MPLIHLIEGPVGAGKSTYAAALATRIGGVHIALDEWFARLFSPDRPDADVMPWYVVRKERLAQHIWTHAQVLLRSGAKPILELGLVQKRSREILYEQARSAGVELKVYVLEASREVRRERVARRNLLKGPTFSMVVPDPIFEFASDMWQSPDATEILEHRIEVVSTELERDDV